MPVKINLDCTEKMWKRVQVFKIRHNCKTMNDAVIRIMDLGLGEGYNA